MFLCGMSVTAADIVVFAHMAKEFAVLPDHEKINLPHAFRWCDHIQHLPGMLELVHSKNLFVPFPDENAEGPSKAQLKKLAKLQAAKDAKEKKKAGGAEESKDQKPKGDKQVKFEKPEGQKDAPVKAEE